MVNLNTKEKLLLEDEKSHEQLCIDKYCEYSSKVKDPELSSLFSQLEKKEQQHLDTINQILQGTVPSVNQGQGQQAQNQQSSSMSNTTQPPENYTADDKAQDKILCQDSLSTEKYVSSTYNTAIFEMRDTNLRQVLNHIQKEEQEHGEQIYNYMSQHGMYN